LKYLFTAATLDTGAATVVAAVWNTVIIVDCVKDGTTVVRVVTLLVVAVVYVVEAEAFVT
jgi:hypothetical protein